jgi:hypothetical protein
MTVHVAPFLSGFQVDDDDRGVDSPVVLEDVYLELIPNAVLLDDYMGHVGATLSLYLHEQCTDQIFEMRFHLLTLLSSVYHLDNRKFT